MKFLRAFLYFFATLALYLGVPLLGWGIRNVSEFFASPPRTGFAILIFLFALAIGIQAINGPQGIRGGKGDMDKLIKRQTVIRYMLVLILYLLLFFIPFGDGHDFGVWREMPVLRWLGLVFSTFGFFMIFWSGISLGKQYSPEVTIQKNHHLITSGAYLKIRHPRYLGVICLGAGVSLLFRSWIGSIIGITVLFMLVLRIKDEENMLAMEFGQEWEQYRKNSWRIIPYIY